MAIVLGMTVNGVNRRGETVEVAISTHPAERFSYSEKFLRNWHPI